MSQVNANINHIDLTVYTVKINIPGGGAEMTSD